MIFSKAQLSRAAFGTDDNWRLSTNGYSAHELVWRLFSDHPDRERDFVFRWETDGLPILYMVSERPPVDRSQLFQTLQSKEYDPKVRRGDRFVFHLRVNPVVKRRVDGRQRVHDVVMDAKKRDEREQYAQAELVQNACYAWLTSTSGEHDSRAERAGFVVDENRFLAESYERHEFKKRSGGRSIVVATTDLRGVLEVTDVDRFRQALFTGVGPSKAFGCGLLTIRRP